jgi:hypothetical protein
VTTIERDGKRKVHFEEQFVGPGALVAEAFRNTRYMLNNAWRVPEHGT